MDAHKNHPREIASRKYTSAQALAPFSLPRDPLNTGLDQYQIQQAQRFERWLAIAGVIASKFNAAAEDGDAAAVAKAAAGARKPGSA